MRKWDPMALKREPTPCNARHRNLTAREDRECFPIVNVQWEFKNPLHCGDVPADVSLIPQTCCIPHSQCASISAPANSSSRIWLLGAAAIRWVSIREVIDYVSDPTRRVCLLKPEELLAMPLFPFKGAVVYLIGNLALTPKPFSSDIRTNLICGKAWIIISSFRSGLWSFDASGNGAWSLGSVVQAMGV